MRHVACPSCHRWLVPLTISAHKETLGRYFGYCPVCYDVYFTEDITCKLPMLHKTPLFSPRPNRAHSRMVLETLLCLIRPQLAYLQDVWRTHRLHSNTAHFVYVQIRMLEAQIEYIEFLLKPFMD